MEIEEDLTTKDHTAAYTLRASHNGSKYVLKGYRINLPFTEAGINAVSGVYREYYFLKSVGVFSPHFARPLCIDQAIELGADSCLYIEVLFECAGVLLNRLEHVDSKSLYSCMKQSANAMLLLHNIGIEKLDIKNMLKLTTAINTDVHHWATAFYLLILRTGNIKILNEVCIEEITNNLKLKKANLIINKSKTENVRAILEAIKRNTTLEKLNLSYHDTKLFRSTSDTRICLH
eukprot:TRINITY_DN1299_c0_g4_i2.p1 TRINITY_DN1299_c0_g4~~TRINITY_DN1299_c0_g4_i2.p1  ORF type:complete len:270 (+),score=4.87 TRINITY_DN1299_c0_g4_i2:112-810(+)